MKSMQLKILSALVVLTFTACGKGSVSSQKAAVPVTLSDVGIFLPAIDPTEGTASKPVFPAVKRGMADINWITKGVTVKIAGCDKAAIIITAVREVGCNLGRGHLAIFAKASGEPTSLVEDPRSPVEGLPGKFQALKFDTSIVTWKVLQANNTYELSLKFPN